MNSTALTLILVLLMSSTLLQGISIVGHSEKCLCSGTGISHFQLSRIKKLDVFPETPRCAKVELLATFMNGIRTCLNLKSPWVKTLMGNLLKKRFG
ncbi:C-X-C motif chemokine 11-1-like [Huso huso]|uniref:C-X-C motif chemokine n=1 Tax=Huso huso TaxID=61971 RepID=A0ABR1ACI4_HUSHU